MARRIRTIKPEILDDEKAAGLSSDAWRLWVCSWLVADDYGRSRGDPRRLAADIFWACPHAVNIAECLIELEDAGLVTRYQVRGENYLLINGWKKHQRIDNASKTFQLPDISEADKLTSLRESPRVAETRGCTGLDPDGIGSGREGKPSLPLSSLLDAWTKAKLPGLPEADALRPVAQALESLNLPFEDACSGFQVMIRGWRKKGIVLPPKPAKMLEHLGIIQQIISGEVTDIDLAGGQRINGRTVTDPSPQYRDATDVLEEKRRRAEEQERTLGEQLR